VVAGHFLADVVAGHFLADVVAVFTRFKLRFCWKKWQTKVLPFLVERKERKNVAVGNFADFSRLASLLAVPALTRDISSGREILCTNFFRGGPFGCLKKNPASNRDFVYWKK
jgi:hypothetical protein